ncbi:MFS transporter [Alkalimarinus alittae]|uniref:MFS transporter n=1 Tax=Alkalimarinus alittae TaxID=2961619 RepID=A0ABY6N1U6_9ALTE|nr:MFS transporter [Alkalimarinus alittae]UZE95974.1 MFS transporter [Alkalimarinus alittae]
MVHTIKPLTQLFLSCFIFMAGNGLVGLLIPMRLSVEAISTDTIGLILSVYAIGYLLGANYSKQVIHKVGHIRTFALCGSLMSFAILICALTMDLWVWGAMRCLMGFAVAIAIATFDGWLSQTTSKSNRGQVLAFNQVVVFSAIAISQFFILLSPPSTTTLFIFAGILFSISISPLVVGRIHGPAMEEFESLPLRQTFKISPLGAVCCLACGLIYAALINLLPLYAAAYGVVDLELSILMASAIAGAVIMQLPIGYLSDRYDRRHLIFTMVAIIVGLSVTFPLIFQLGLLIPAYIIIGVMSGLVLCLYPLGISETFDKVPQSQMVGAMSSLLGFYAIGSIFGPYSGSLMMEYSGPQGLFITLSSLEVLLLGFVFYRIKARESLPLEQQESFVMTSPNSVVPHLDPRTVYEDSSTETSPMVDSVIQLALDNPQAAVKLAQMFVKNDHDQAQAIAAALSEQESIGITQIYKAIIEQAPELSADIADTLVSAHPEQMEQLVEFIMQGDNDNRNAILLAIANSLPNFGSAAIQTAVDNIGDDQSEELLELTEEYFQQVHEEASQMRPADLAAEDPQQAAAEVFSHIIESATEQHNELAHKASEAMPEASEMVAETYISNLIDQQDEAPEEEQQQELGEAISNYMEHVVENQPEQATDIAATIVEQAPEHASDVVEILQSTGEGEISSEIPKK